MTRTTLASLFDAAIAALAPRALVDALLARRTPAVQRVLRAGRRRGILAVGAGKGAARIAAALESALAPAVAGGLVIVPPGYACALRRVRVRVASHPLPDARGVAATRALLALVARTASPVLVVLTGGASSLLELPAAGLQLRDVRATYACLLASGATIAETNTVRTALSAVKGGRLARRLGGRAAATLVLSDVPGDDLAVVGSGPTMRTRTTATDAVRVLRRYGLEHRVPPRVLRHLVRAARGDQRRPRAGTVPAVPAFLLGGNVTALAGIAHAARDRGYGPVTRLRTPLTGTPANAARRLAARMRALRARATTRTPRVMVAGGETTVRLSAQAPHGRGGRNQELALEVARRLAGVRGWALLCAGSDGIDGPTDAAGAFVDGGTCARAARAGRSIDDALARHDVYPLLDAIGALYRPGPTGTNVADVAIALVWRARAR